MHPNFIILFKIYLPFTFMCFAFTVKGQNLNQRQLHQIQKLGVPTHKYNTSQHTINSDFNLILKNHKQQKLNKTLGYIFSAIAIGGTSLGILAFSNSTNTNGMSNATSTVVGTYAALVGIGSGKLAIKLFGKAKRKKQARNAILKKYRS